MRYYIIDGNNLIHKIPALKNLQQKDKQLSREKIALMIDRFFISKNVKVEIVFDGFPNEAINTSKARIYYSEKEKADNLIRRKIEFSDNPKLITIVSSDTDITNLARKCSCKIIASENFAKEIQSNKNKDEEIEKTKSISNDEIRKLFLE